MLKSEQKYHYFPILGVRVFSPNVSRLRYKMAVVTPTGTVASIIPTLQNFFETLW